MTFQIRGVLTLVVLATAFGLSAVRADDTPVKLPDAISKAWAQRFKDAKLESVKQRGDDSYDIKASDKFNNAFKVSYDKMGRILYESKRRVPMADLPEAVSNAAKGWNKKAMWPDPATVETKKGEKPVWLVTGMLNGKAYRAWIQDDGKILKSDELPEKVQKFDEKGRAILSCC